MSLPKISTCISRTRHQAKRFPNLLPSDFLEGFPETTQILPENLKNTTQFHKHKQQEIKNVIRKFTSLPKISTRDINMHKQNKTSNKKKFKFVTILNWFSRITSDVAQLYLENNKNKSKSNINDGKRGQEISARPECSTQLKRIINHISQSKRNTRFWNHTEMMTTVFIVAGVDGISSVARREREIGVILSREREIGEILSREREIGEIY
ncbi:hypothetical protein YC2023_098247 [Brassica napus]